MRSIAPEYDTHSPSDLADIGKSLIRDEAHAISRVVLDDAFLRAIECVVSGSGRVIACGAGTSGRVAHRCAHLLAASGTPSQFIHPSDGLHGGLGVITSGDLVLAISKGGRSSELNEFVARSSERGATVSVLTSTADTPLADRADVLIMLPSYPAADPGEVLAMGSSLVAAAWGDAFAWALMNRRGYSWMDFFHTHPGGAVGQRLSVAKSTEEKQ